VTILSTAAKALRRPIRKGKMDLYFGGFGEVTDLSGFGKLGLLGE